VRFYTGIKIKEQAMPIKLIDGGESMPTVKVYSTPTCPYCHLVKEFLTQKRVKFEDINVAEDHEAAQEMIEKSGQMGVPQIEINGKIIVGFDREAIEQELKKMKK
jgi:glutaredoxin-like YruB-family protein